MTFVSCSTEESTEDDSQKVINVVNGEALVVQDYNGWDEIRTSADGSTFFNKYSDDGSMMESTMFMLNNDSIGLIYGYAKFDENEMPQFVCYNGVTIIVDRYYDELIDASVIVGDSIVFSVDSLQLGFDPRKLNQTRSAKQNNWIRNVCNVGAVVTSVIGVGTGTVMVLAGGAGTLLTGGAASGVSVPTIIAGVATIGLSTKSLNDALNNMFVEKYNDREISSPLKDYNISTASDAFTEILGKATQESTESFLTNNLPQEAANVLNSKGFNITTLLASLTFSSIDALWGQTITIESAIREKYLNCLLITGKATNITEKSARLNGYVSGESAQGFQTRYGFIVRSQEGHVTTPPIDNGIGESFFVDCTKLSEATRYKYIAYFWDYTNGYIKFGAARTFRTDGVPAVIKNVSKNHSERDGDGQINYNLKVNLELQDDDDILDWGFYYLEDGVHKSYSLKEYEKGEHSYNFPYKSASTPITLKMGTYVKYKSEGDVAHYGENTSYSFSHNDNYGITIEHLNVSLESYISGAASFGIDMTVNNNIKNADGIISYGYYIAERPYYPGTYKKYSHHKTSTTTENTVAKHATIRIYKHKFDEIDKENFIANCNRYSVGTYVRFQDSTFLHLDERDIVLSYNRKPKVEFVKAEITNIETLPYNDVENQYYTHSEYIFETSGSFWIENATLNIWSATGLWQWEELGGTSQSFPFYEDRRDTLTHRPHYYDSSEKDFYLYFGLNLTDGSRQSSENSLHYYGSPVINNVSISDRMFDAYYNKIRAAKTNAITDKRKHYPTISVKRK